MFIFPVLFVLFGQLCLLGYAQTCYWPDGSVGEELISCNGMAKESHCCGADSLCLNNGYCFNQGNEYGNRISRGGCTDKSWDSNACPQNCQTAVPTGGISISIVSETDTGRFCCGMGRNITSGLCFSESRSGDSSPFTIKIGVAIVDRTSGSTTLNTTASGTGAGTTATATVTVTVTPHPRGTSASIGTAIGVGVAVSVGILLISAVMGFLWQLRKRKTPQAFQQLDYKTSYPPTPQIYDEHIELEHSPLQFQGLGIQELDGHRYDRVHDDSQYKGM